MPELRPLPYSPPEIERQILHDLGDVAKNAVVLSSTATYVTMPARRPNDVDLSVSESDYKNVRAYLLEQPGWSDKTLHAGRPGLANGIYEIGIGWGEDMSHEQLVHTGWLTAQGLAVASLSHVCLWKLRHHRAKDQMDNEHTRRYLHDPSQLPLPARVMSREVEIISNCLPEAWRDSPEAQQAARLAAIGLLTVSALYGGPDLRQPGQIIGALEQPEFNVPALYHNGIDLPDDMKAVVTHLQNIGASREDILDAVISVAFADSVYGNGRESDQLPGGNDELRSARLVKSRALSLGFGATRAARLFDIIDGTAYNEALHTQKGKKSSDVVARAVVGVDLHGLSLPKDAWDICLEDNMAARYSRDRTLGKVMNEQDLRLREVAELLTFVDENSSARPSDAPDGPTIREAVINRLESDASFLETHNYPHDWTLDNKPLRLRKAAQTRAVVAHWRANPKASLLEAYNNKIVAAKECCKKVG